SERPDCAPRIRGQRSVVVGALAQRGPTDVHARVPREAHLLMWPSFATKPRSHEVILVGLLRVFVSSWLAILFVCGVCSAAVDDYIGKPIGSVRLLVEGRDVVEPAMTAVVETQVGQPLSMAQVRETIAHLFSLRRF